MNSPEFARFTSANARKTDQRREAPMEINRCPGCISSCPTPLLH